jgi:hypothetical protein
VIAALAVVTLCGAAVGVAAAFDLLPGSTTRAEPPRAVDHVAIDPVAVDPVAVGAVALDAVAIDAVAIDAVAIDAGVAAVRESPSPDAGAVLAQPALARVHVTVVGPAAAELWIDGSPVGRAPFEGAVERDRRLHTIEARAAGWSSASSEVSFDLRQQRITLRMERERPARPGDHPCAREPSLGGPAERAPGERRPCVRSRAHRDPPPIEERPPPPPRRRDEPLVGSDVVFRRP